MWGVGGGVWGGGGVVRGNGQPEAPSSRVLHTERCAAYATAAAHVTTHLAPNHGQMEDFEALAAVLASKSLKFGANLQHLSRLIVRYGQATAKQVREKASRLKGVHGMGGGGAGGEPESCALAIFGQDLRVPLP